MSLHDANRQHGQAAVEYLMIAGLVAAFVIAATTLIIPAVSSMVVSMIRMIAVYLTSVPD